MTEYLTETEVVTLTAGLSEVRLSRYIERGYLKPADPSGPAFDGADLSRARLLCFLEEEGGIGEEGLDIVLGLLDQVHGLRSRLAEMNALVARIDPDAVKRAASD